MKLYMFRAVPLSIIKSLFTVHSALVYVIQVRVGAYAPALKLSTNLYDIYQCRVYSEYKLLMMDRGTARNM